MKSDQLPVHEYPTFFEGYIQALENVHLIEELEICLHDFIKFVQNIPMGKFEYAYSEGKWTIKEIIQHIIDTERILSYRALRFSRKDNTPLASFNENDYVAFSNAKDRNLKDLLSELSSVRQATLALYKSFSQEQLKGVGTASGQEISLRALGFVIIGHQKHHQKVFQERYL
jgi:uncharacterized damage-inducible protein DinB